MKKFQNPTIPSLPAYSRLIHTGRQRNGIKLLTENENKPKLYLLPPPCDSQWPYPILQLALNPIQWSRQKSGKSKGKAAKFHKNCGMDGSVNSLLSFTSNWAADSSHRFPQPSRARVLSHSAAIVPHSKSFHREAQANQQLIIRRMLIVLF